MAKYQERPKTIEAWKWPEEADVIKDKVKDAMVGAKGNLYIQGIAERIKVTPGDYIVEMPDGSYGVCQTLTFETAYQKVEEPAMRLMQNTYTGGDMIREI